MPNTPPQPGQTPPVRRSARRSATKGLPSVLCVDDEPHVLEGLKLQLRRTAVVTTATSGDTALEILESSAPFHVIISDMRMPGMSGAELLRHARERYPDTTRMLLTGQSDLDSAISAVNEGQVFRFLTKPCPPAALQMSVAQAARQHALVTAERVLLEQTLRGAIRTLTEVLALSHPIAFGRSTRIRKTAVSLAKRLGIQSHWHIEVAAMVSQLGWVSLPDDTLHRVYQSQPLSEDERRMVQQLPRVTEKLLAHIPRLDAVVNLLRQHTTRYQPDGLGGDPVPIGARVLRAAVDFEMLVGRGLSTEIALDTMGSRVAHYPPSVLEALASLHAVGRPVGGVVEVPISGVEPGMMFADDVWLTNGVLLVASGQTATVGLVERARNYRAGMVREPVRVRLPPPEE